MMDDWKHVFKLDPEREISDDHLDLICMSGTDAVIVGGTSGVTFDNTVELLSRIRKYEVPCALEISAADAVVPGFDLYLIPVVMNTDRGEWIMGKHQQAVKELGALIPWELVAALGYVVLNSDSDVGRVTEANTELDEQDVAAYARRAEHLYHFPVLYLEYSGRFGSMEHVKRARSSLQHTRLFYGGGITSLEQAKLAAEAADTIVVGNILYDQIEQALATVRVKNKD